MTSRSSAEVIDRLTDYARDEEIPRAAREAIEDALGVLRREGAETLDAWRLLCNARELQRGTGSIDEVVAASRACVRSATDLALVRKEAAR